MACLQKLPGRHAAGFTLVELAIVMIIIGLLIAGVLKGQQLIGNARTTSTVAQIKSFRAALLTFQDMYQNIPGDMTSPGTRLPGCTGACADPNGVSNGNGHLDNPPAGVSIGTEGEMFFLQMSAADLITGIQAGGGPVFGGEYPQTKIDGGGFTAGYSPLGAAADFGVELVDATNMPSGLYLNMHGGSPAGGTQFTSPVTASRIDVKLDDGVPSRGSIRAKTSVIGTTPDACASAGAAGAYNTQYGGDTCGLFISLQN